MYLDPFLFGRYEPVLTDVVRRLLRPGDTAFDVGANFGWFTTLFALLVRPGGRVVAFEPVPSLAQITEESIELNSAGDVVRLEVMGLGADDGTFTVHTFPGLPLGHASASDLGREDATPHRCTLSTLDDYMSRNGIGALDFLKIDVEGYELEVLTGGSESLSAPRAPVVHFEVTPECLAKGRKATELQDVLSGYGYTDFWQINPARGTTKWAGPISDHRADYLAATPRNRGRVLEAVRR